MNRSPDSAKCVVCGLSPLGMIYVHGAFICAGCIRRQVEQLGGMPKFRDEDKNMKKTLRFWVVIGVGVALGIIGALVSTMIFPA